MFFQERKDIFRNIFDFAIHAVKENAMNTESYKEIELIFSDAMNDKNDYHPAVATAFSICKSALGSFSMYVELIAPYFHASDRISRFEDLLRLLEDLGLYDCEKCAEMMQLCTIGQNELGIPEFSDKIKLCENFHIEINKFLTKSMNMNQKNEKFRTGIYALVYLCINNSEFIELYDRL
ncbi:hypothetical protein TVAG_168360 [Trichomonas vaginalis G3]|uniref:Uncharacterized protein n=1 Tax=Trichomonas vaginalis (strain ATCC PRA-98 / G3) TaxID=412133 RepID=A2F2D9_TRIV3|nr:hypothetical protein TVAGG3_0252880 [Trichomonas vaginalis G3]EAY00905.1 hypothetical protein TVAG_168360 [Trichomonas vaginalis G3]KAI5554144.1 hypothetical protein TVAGG3_0252880 [Trichomonas vaginalis G3]|eukprot:XP_001313834.1 hypothetical protein [Trichomonas vaginalis G3]